MNKIEFKDLPDTTTPINASNLNTLQDNIEDEFNEVEEKINAINNYSATETVIGQDKNGKPKYKLDANVTSPNSINSYVEILDLTSYNIKNIIDLNGTLHALDGRELPVNYPEPDYTICTSFKSDKLEMRIQHTLWQERPCDVTLIYTKTTD